MALQLQGVSLPRGMCQPAAARMHGKIGVYITVECSILSCVFVCAWGVGGGGATCPLFFVISQRVRCDHLCLCFLAASYTPPFSLHKLISLHKLTVAPLQSHRPMSRCVSTRLRHTRPLVNFVCLSWLLIMGLAQRVAQTTGSNPRHALDPKGTSPGPCTRVR